MGCLSCAGFIKGMSENEGATRLTLKSPVSGLIDAPCLIPEKLAGRNKHEIASLALTVNGEQKAVGDIFFIETGLTEEIILEGDLSHLNNIGKKMRHGSMTIRGNTGDHLGAFMQGGSIYVDGDVGEYAGAQMTGGHIRIKGNAGDRAGALYPGRIKGIDQGTILIDGNAGSELGTGMRRGLIAVRGNAGECAGAQMHGGTIFVFGKIGKDTGIGNRRGTIVTFGGMDTMLPAYQKDCTYSPVYLNCYFKLFRDWKWALPCDVESGLFIRHIGDKNVNGKGEILVYCKSE